MRKFLLPLLMLWLPTMVAAAPLMVSEGVLTTGIANRSPVDSVTSVPADVGRLYCYTRIEGAGTKASVSHVWYRGEKEMARVVLPVRSGNWRTWSSKRILPGWVGDWHVDVLDGEGRLLKSMAFTVQ